MPRFSGEYRETFVVRAPLEKARDHFADLDTIAANYGGLVKHEKKGDDTLYFLLKPKAEKGISFQGEYTARYVVDGDVLRWSTVDGKNMWSEGTARFVREGDDRTRVEYHQRIETEMSINRLLAKIASPIVSREITNGVKQYLQRMRNAL